MRTEDEILKHWKKEHEPMVSIVCIAYNHERYIEQALRGFFIQITDFPFEIIIHDDASTDATAAVIADYAEHYPKIIRCIFQKENQFSKGKRITPILLAYARAKYIAFCEGDDYWSDPYKLQKQVDFLEAHQNYSMCCTNFSVIDVDGNIILNEGWSDRKTKNVSITHEMVLESYVPKTLTSVIRREAIPKSWPREYYASPNGDNFLFALVTKNGDAAYLDTITGCYSEHTSGIWSLKGVNERYKMQLVTCKQLKIYFNNRKDKKAIDKRIIRIGKNLLIASIRNNDLKEIFNISVKLSLNGLDILFRCWHSALQSLF